MKLNSTETDLFVSIVNSLIEKYCEKYPDEFEFDSAGIAYDEKLKIFAENGDDLDEVLKWVFYDVIPDVTK